MMIPVLLEKVNSTLEFCITSWEALDYYFATVIIHLSNIVLDFPLLRNLLM